ncbi:hypothetical protein F5Y13DRAFT_197884 [Hypoxylon sp. FL1857]|nr:hypothetical protein F5Y13DRAFT_197884 [Hypoxylon sp. FL1857]
MESPSKKLKLGHAPYDDDDDDETNLDELSMTPTQFDARQDPLYHLDKGRAKAATRLKSAFERIFEKYERDFTGVGDEIDLATGEVVINNGHLQSLEDEKDRAREGSISSDEEERIMRGKGVKPTEDARADSSKNNPERSLVVQKQPDMTVGANHQFAPFGMPPNDPGFPNPGPLWQAPEVPVTLYQDRFGFMGQPVGYPSPYGYGYGPMHPPGAFGNRPLSSLLHSQVPKKLHCTKTSGRKLLPRVSPSAEDSEEDDVLLGDNTQENAKSTTPGNKKSTPLATTAGNAMPPVEGDGKQTSMAVAEISQKQRRPGRPRKTTIPTKPPESNDETIQERDESTDTDTAPSIQTSDALSESTITSPPEEESILARQIAAKLAQAKALTRQNVESLDEQNRRSSRARRKTEFYSQITWTKGRVTDNASNEASDSSTLDTSSSTGDTGPEDSQLEDVRQPESNGQVGENAEEQSTGGLDDGLPDQEKDRDELPVIQVDTNRDRGLVENDARDLRSRLEGTEQPGPLSPNGETGTEDIEIPQGDKETLSNGPSVDSPNEKGFLHTLHDSNQCSHGDNQNTNSDSRIEEDMNIALDVKITVRDIKGNEIPGTSREIHESIFVPDGSHGETQDPPVQTEPEETVAPLPGLVQEETQTPEIPELETAETEPQADDAASRPSPTEHVSEPRHPPSEDDSMFAPTETPFMLTAANERAPAETSKLVIRPLIPHVSRGSASKDIEEGNRATSSSPPETRPAEPARAAANTPVPRTPKKPREPEARAESRRGTQRRTSIKRKISLTSLVPDDPNEDDDELSILSPSVAPNPFLSNPRLGRVGSSTSIHSSTPRKTGHRTGSLLGANTKTPHRISKRTAPPATDSRAFGSSKRRFNGTSSAIQSSPLSRSVMHVDRSDIFATTPLRWDKNLAEPSQNPMSSSPVRTPGGSARRCGEDGYVCERDFCFTCCK